MTLSLLTAGVLVASPATFQAPDTAAITSFVESFVKRAQIPGAAVSVVGRDGLLYARGFGTAGRSGRPVTPDSPFYIGSTTKTMTATAILQLADEGALHLDDPVPSVLPGFEVADPRAAARLTVRHLLTHTSGFAAISAFDRRAQEQGLFAHIDLASPPGTVARYSSLNYVVLGEIVEAASGITYGAFLRKGLFGPLGMDRTFTDRASAVAAGLVQGHTYFFGWPVARAEPPYPRRMIPTGYVTSTANDLARYLGLFLGRGMADDRGVLSAGALEEMFTVWDGAETGHGIAWGVIRWNGLEAYYHAGMNPGFFAQLLILPELGFGIAVLANRNAGPFFPAPRDLLDGVVRRVAGQELVPYGRRELWIRLAFLAATLVTLGQLFRHGWVWKRAGAPRRISGSRRVLALLALEVAFPIALVAYILRGLARISFAGMMEFYPDLGILLALALVTGIPSAILKAWNRSARLRNAGRPPGSPPRRDPAIAT